MTHGKSPTIAAVPQPIRLTKSTLVGGQFGLTYLPWVLSVNVHGFYEYLAKDRFQGGSFGVSVAKKFW